MATTLIVLFLVVSIINILYYLGYFSFATSQSNNPESSNIPVSVIICAKNEAENLKQFIPSILNQKYPNFEVILINDASEDDTLEVMENFLQEDPRIKPVSYTHLRAHETK